MSNKDHWCRQCTYETTPDEKGTKREGTSWIPEELAVVGKKIYFGKKTDSPKELWVVTHVGERQREDICVANRMAWKHQRKQSDI